VRYSLKRPKATSDKNAAGMPEDVRWLRRIKPRGVVSICSKFDLQECQPLINVVVKSLAMCRRSSHGLHKSAAYVGESLHPPAPLGNVYTGSDKTREQLVRVE